MSTTTETTEKSTIPLPSPDQPASAPEVKIFSRVASIPLISSFLSTVDSNTYAHSAYTHAKGLYKYTEPIQVRIAPLIVCADDYANKAVDVVESQFPYAFQAKPEDIRQKTSEYVRERKESANKTIDERVRTPAYAVVEGIDQRFAPIVSYFESKLNAEGKPYTPAESKYQYQRALALSKEIKDQVYVYSNEQLKELQAHNALVHRATETAQSLNHAATSSIAVAQARVQALSDSMLSELQKIQSSAAQLAASLQNTASSLPPHVRQVYSEFSTNVSSTITDLREILAQKDVPFQEKVNKVGNEVRERITPLLENGKKTVQEVIARARTSSTTPDEPPEPTVNGIEGHTQ